MSKLYLELLLLTQNLGFYDDAPKKKSYVMRLYIFALEETLITIGQWVYDHDLAMVILTILKSSYEVFKSNIGT